MIPGGHLGDYFYVISEHSLSVESNMT